MSKATPAATRGPGRPMKEASELITSSWRRTEEQGLKCEALGGSAWIRKQIDAAPWPRGSKPKK